MPTLAPWQWILGALCAFMVGVAKTGMPGVGILAIPLMVITAGDTKSSAGWLLPILCTADLFAVFYWRRHAAANKLISLVPWVVVGMAGGAAALYLKEQVLRPMVGIIVLIMLVLYLYRRFKSDLRPAHGGIYGMAAGFATTVANAAGPVMNLYLLTKQLPKEEFVATGAWFFFVINLAKIPIYAWHGMFTRTSLIFDAVLVPVVLLGALTGRWLLGRVPPHIFEAMVIFMTIASTILLFR